MKSHIINLQIRALAVVAIGLLPVLCVAQPATNQAPATPPAQAPPHKFADEAEGRDYDVFQNFEGTITGINLKTKMITVRCEGRRFLPMKVVPDTKLTKDGKPATLKDAVIGGTVSGVAGMEKGKFDAMSLDFKTEAKQ